MFDVHQHMLSPAELWSQATLVAAVKSRLNNRAMASDLWRRIRALRKHTKLSGEAFGAELGVSKAAVSQWESADPSKSTKPELQTILDMARKFGAPLNWLLDEQTDPELEWWLPTAAAAGPTQARKTIDLSDALPVVLSHMAAVTQRDKLRTALMALLDDDAPAYRQRLAELLSENTDNVSAKQGHESIVISAQKNAG